MDVEVLAKVTSKGQITIPVAVRRALGLEAGDRVVFRVVDGRAVVKVDGETHEGTSAELEKIPDFFDLAGSVPVPVDVDPMDWTAQREAGWEAAARARP